MMLNKLNGERISLRKRFPTCYRSRFRIRHEKSSASVAGRKNFKMKRMLDLMAKPRYSNSCFYGDPWVGKPEATFVRHKF
jgi:hypothetical protein